MTCHAPLPLIVTQSVTSLCERPSCFFSARMFKPKPEQQEAVKSLLEGKDVLAVLPTGFGKSYIYQNFSEITNSLNDPSVVLVISPLASIIKDQIISLNSKTPGIAAELPLLTPEELKECSFKILFSSAEDTLQKKFTEELKSSASLLNKNLALIVVDETHTVETWSGKR